MSVDTPASSANRIWFTSRSQDPDTGLVYMGTRYYDPVVGRFLMPDPVQFDERNLHSFNRYGYANNNPYKYVDRDGREAFVIFHPAVWNSMSNPSRLFHAAILLRPDNPVDFVDRTGWRSDKDGGISATLGAQPAPDVATLSLGKLVATPNNEGDRPEKSWDRIKIERPAGMSDTDWINALIRTANSYKDDKPYAWDPNGNPGSFNSNSYVSGVINAAGGKAPSLPVSAPGYNRPLPLP